MLAVLGPLATASSTTARFAWAQSRVPCSLLMLLLCAGLQSMESESGPQGDSSSDQPSVLRIRFEESEGSIRLSSVSDENSPASSSSSSSSVSGVQLPGAESSSQGAEDDAARPASSSEQGADEAASSQDADDQPGPGGQGLEAGDLPGGFT